MGTFNSALLQAPCRILGYAFLVVGLTTGAVAAIHRPLMANVSQILRSDQLIPSPGLGGILLAISGAATSLAVLFASVAVGVGQCGSPPSRALLVIDLITVFAATAWVAMLAMLCCFLMLIGSG